MFPALGKSPSLASESDSFGFGQLLGKSPQEPPNSPLSPTLWKPYTQTLRELEPGKGPSHSPALLPLESGLAPGRRTRSHGCPTGSLPFGRWLAGLPSTRGAAMGAAEGLANGLSGAEPSKGPSPAGSPKAPPPGSTSWLHQAQGLGGLCCGSRRRGQQAVLPPGPWPMESPLQVPPRGKVHTLYTQDMGRWPGGFLRFKASSSRL